MSKYPNAAESGQTELALRESEAQFRSAMENSPIGMGLVSPEGRWLEVNAALCRIVGYPRAELLAIDFQSITHPDDLAADRENGRRILNREISIIQTEKRYLHKDGHIVWISLSASLVRCANGEPRYFISHIQDITERKKPRKSCGATRKFWRSWKMPSWVATATAGSYYGIPGRRNSLAGKKRKSWGGISPSGSPWKSSRTSA